ncbi:MAG: glycine betaine ABC transporter substrate-binding protein [Candidatus Velthaea sp.]
MSTIGPALLSRARALALCAGGAVLAACGARDANRIAVGSKNFTEELLLGEIYAQTLEHGGFAVTRKLNLGGTDIAMAALQRGEIDLYPEYTGTALLVQLKQPPVGNAAQIYSAVKRAYAERYGLEWLRPAPMNDTQALATTQPLAAKYGLRTLSDVARMAPQLRLGAVPEFVKRPDGLPGLQKAYGGFLFKQTRLIDIGLKYKALLNGDVDVVVAFGTDGAIDADRLVVFADDKHFWPAYQVAPVVRRETLAAHPAIAEQLDKIAPLLTDATMRGLNNQVDGPQKREVADVAKDFLHAHGLG